MEEHLNARRGGFPNAGPTCPLRRAVSGGENEDSKAPIGCLVMPLAEYRNFLQFFRSAGDRGNLQVQ